MRRESDKEKELQKSIWGALESLDAYETTDVWGEIPQSWAKDNYQAKNHRGAKRLAIYTTYGWGYLSSDQKGQPLRTELTSPRVSITLDLTKRNLQTHFKRFPH